nr:reverse transcriptase domain-containing protein [Tanacetum cinerariifolium]
MQTRSSSKLAHDQTSNPTSSTNPTPKGRIRRSSKQKVENSHFEEHPTLIATMTDNRTMAEMLRPPIEGCAEAIIVPSIIAEQFELKHSLINMMTSEQFFGLEKYNPHDHVWGARRWLKKEPPRSITTWYDLVSKFINEFFPPSRTTNLRNEILNFQQKFDESFHEAWERYKDLLRACPHHGFTELHQLDTFYNALNPADQDSLNAAAGVNLLEKSPQDALTIIENKSKFRNSQSKPIASPVNACDNHSSSELAKLTHAVNQQTSVVTTVMTAMLKQFQSNPPSALVKAVEEICVTCEVLIRTTSVLPPVATLSQSTEITFKNFHLNELEKIKRMNDVSLKAMQNQIDMVKNELRNEMKISIQTSLSNQTNEIKNMMASLLQMNTASTSGSGTLLDNTVANPKGELKAITTRSGLVTEGPTVPNPPKSVNPEEDECVEEMYTDPDHAENNIKVPPPPPVQKPKPPIQRNFVLHTRDSLPPHIPYSSRVLKQKHELKCKALADLGASINLMPLYIWKTLGLPDLIPTRMTLKLANRVICTPDGIARDVFIPVGEFTFLADFVVVDYESDPRVPLILGRPFLRAAHALIDVHGEEMILCDGDEMLTLNMKYDTASYSNCPHRESVNLINIFNLSSEDCLEDLVSNKQSGNPTFSLHKEIALPEVIHELHDSKGCNFLSKELSDIDSYNDVHSYFDDDPLSGSTTYSANSLLEEFADELALISYPLDYDDNRTRDIDTDIREIDFLLYQGEDSDFKDSIDQSDLTHRDDLFVDPTPEMFTNEQPPHYSFPSRFDVYPDDFLEIKSDATFDDDLFDSEGEKIKVAELLIDQLDLPSTEI